MRLDLLGCCLPDLQNIPKKYTRYYTLLTVLPITVLCLRKKLTVILNTCTIFANSLTDNADVCDGLLY